MSAASTQPLTVRPFRLNDDVFGMALCGPLFPDTVLQAGVPVHVAAARLGHADPAITLRVYAHVLQDQAWEAADVFAGLLGRGQETARWQIRQQAAARETRNRGPSP